MRELVFEVTQETDDGYCAEYLAENIFTERDTWEQLRKNVIEVTTGYFFDGPAPERIRLRLVRDEVLSVPSSAESGRIVARQDFGGA